jgi:hypothetical protein
VNFSRAAFLLGMVGAASLFAQGAGGPAYFLPGRRCPPGDAHCLALQGNYTPYGYHPNWTSPGYLYSRPWYVPPVDPYIPLSNEERYLGAKHKGDRAAERGNWKQAATQYQDAWDRATHFWGEGSRQAQEAVAALRRARFKSRLRGKITARGDFQTTLRRGHRARRRGDGEAAARAYREALRRARTSAQGEEAAEWLAAVR